MDLARIDAILNHPDWEERLFEAINTQQWFPDEFAALLYSSWSKAKSIGMLEAASFVSQTSDGFETANKIAIPAACTLIHEALVDLDRKNREDFKQLRRQMAGPGDHPPVTEER